MVRRNNALLTLHGTCRNYRVTYGSGQRKERIKLHALPCLPTAWILTRFVGFCLLSGKIPNSIHSLTRSVIFHTCILLISYLDTRFTWIQLHLIFEDNSLLSSLRSLEFIIVLPSLNQFIIHSYLWPEGEIFNIHSRSAFWKQCSTSYRLASRLLARKRSNEMQRTRQSRPLARMCNHLSYFPL